jgi:hypothetical protein
MKATIAVLSLAVLALIGAMLATAQAWLDRRHQKTPLPVMIVPSQQPSLKHFEMIRLCQVSYIDMACRSRGVQLEVQPHS